MRDGDDVMTYRQLSSTDGCTAPRTATTQALATIWQDVLDVDRVGVHDDFFELGGDSILALTITALSEVQGFAFTIQDIFQHRSVAELSALAKDGSRDVFRSSETGANGAI